ncbi:cyclohexanecarboxylate-CoA ligase [Pueribacillus theae]|uniref:Cyclohexanecarboxylate-CoA ligase n=1 Tax=Pueribacillus theae TaxID=2171751 RepID=A0A2U1JPG5_9BACI|nr:AMP-binding protein [Pueribacillus theae]PWA07061.1 cyclohexanecarboxylate-CoA ligase [Pueribacillus theae]
MAFETLLTAERIEEMERKGLWFNETMIDHLNQSVDKFSGKEAVYDGRTRLTYRELANQVKLCAAGLAALGIEKNTVVSLQLPNWVEFLVFHYAATLLGAVTNPLVPIYREKEISYMVDLAESKVYVAPKKFRNFDYEEMIYRLKPNLPSLQNIIIVGEPEESESLAYEEWMLKWEETKEVENSKVDPNEVTEIIFTSGTTGEPKGALHTHNTLTCATKGMIDHLRLTEDDVIHMASTFAHQTGFLYGARMPIQCGGKGVYQDIWNSEKFVEMVEEEKITVTFGATPFLHDLLNAKNLNGHDISSLRIFVCAGAPIPKPLLEEALEKLPNCKVLGAWGQTEDAIVTVGNLSDPIETITSSDGVSISKGMEVRVVDEDGNELPYGVEGNLEVRGSFVFVGYAKRLEKTKEEFDKDWFMTGDLAVMDESGHIKISGRSKDIIIRGGENIPVAYVEDVLHSHPHITTAAVVSVPCPRLQERACACVALKEGTTLTMESLKEFLETQGIAKQYWPEYLEVFNELPRTPSGKIQKFKLREKVKNKATQTS